MKVTIAFLVSSLYALNVLAAPQDEPATSTRELTPLESCLAGCRAGDVNCQAVCVGVPNPTEDGVNQTTECEANCEQGDGTEAETRAFAECKQACYSSYFYTSGAAAPTSTGTATAASDAEATETGTSDSEDESGKSQLSSSSDRRALG